MRRSDTASNKLKALLSNPELWARYFLRIVDKNGKSVPFVFNQEQHDLITSLDKYNIVLKSRQLGITSVACALSLYYCFTEPGSCCLLMSYSLDSAKGIFNKLKSLYNSIPDCVRVQEIANNRTELRFANNSQIVVCTCGNRDVARGLTLRFAHLSEIAFFDQERAKKNLLAIEQAMQPNGVMVLESTANGFNHFSDLWSGAERGNNLYRPFFYGWVDDKQMFADEYKQFAERWRQKHGTLPTVPDLDEEEKALYDRGATIEQIVWRRLKIANSSPEQFRQEFPSNAVEAFTTTGRNIFDTALIHDKLAVVHKPIAVPAEFANMGVTFWEMPRPGQRYYIGVDASEGTGGDHSAVEVLNADLCQCAELYSNTIKPFRLAEIVLKLGHYYNDALLVVEKASGGHTVLDKLKNQFGYANIYKCKSYDAAGNLRRKAGWETTAKTRPLLINDFVEVWESGQCWINSPVLLGEMQLFVDKGGRAEHAGRTGDDAIFAFGMAIQGYKSGQQYF
jgi:hypothetical protein